MLAYLDIFILQRFDIEANRWYSLNCLIRLVLESVQDCGLSCIIQTKDQDANFLGPEKGFKHSAHYDSHDCGFRFCSILLLESG